MRTLNLFLAFLFISINLTAQKKQLTISDAVSDQYQFLYPNYINGLKWQPNTNNYTYVKMYSKIVKSSVKSKKETDLLNVDDLNKILHSIKKDSVKYIAAYTWVSSNKIKFDYDKYQFIYNIKTKKIEQYTKFPDKSDNIFYCKQNSAFVFTIDNNLYYIDKENNKFAITADTNKGIVNGQTVSRSEFGIDHGIFWSPKGNYLAFYKKDETRVTNYPLVDITKTPAVVKNIKYPMAGGKSEYLKIGVYDIKTKKTIFLKTDGKQYDQYLINPTWSPDEKYILVAVLNREQNHMKYNKYDAHTGEFIKTLFEEKNDKWVEPENFAFFLNNNQFIWQSERDGYNHMYLYDLSGKLIKQLTKGKWIVTKILGKNKTSDVVYFKSTKDSPLELRLYSINIKTNNLKLLTNNEGIHRCKLSSDYKYFIDSYSNIKTPHVYNINSTNGKLVKNIKTADNPLKDYNINMPEIGTIKAADGKTDLYYRLIKPSNFDKTKKYPVIVYVYGGPHAQLITNSWMAGAQMWLYYMAQRGYVIFTLDNRGSANRGFEFENVIHRQLGQNEMKDQLKGIDFLKSLEYVDTNRIGVDGWSFGGFMTVSLKLNYPDIFKVGVAGGPVIDWKYYEVMYGERYMDMPQENPEGYKLCSVLNKVDNLKGKLLIIHGGIDPTVVWQNSLKFIRECVKKQKQVDYFVYPRSEHNVRGIDRNHLMTKITMYFDDYLKNAK